MLESSARLRISRILMTLKNNKRIKIMGKTLVGRRYMPKGCMAIDSKTGAPVDLGEREYHIIKDVYTRPLTHKSDKGREYKLDREVIDVIDILSGRQYTVEFKPGSLVDDPEVTKAYEEDPGFMAEATEFMKKIKGKVPKGSGFSLMVIASQDKGSKRNVTGLLLGNPVQIADSVNAHLSQDPQMAGLIGAAALAARLKK